MNNILQPNGFALTTYGFKPYQTSANGYPYSNYLMNTNKIVVNNIEDVKQYPVPPGGDYLFTHATEPILFRKVVDAYGQFKITQFGITELNVDENTPTDKYVSIDQFNLLKSEFEAFKNKSAEVVDEPVKQQ